MVEVVSVVFNLYTTSLEWWSLGTAALVLQMSWHPVIGKYYWKKKTLCSSWLYNCFWKVIVPFRYIKNFSIFENIFLYTIEFLWVLTIMCNVHYRFYHFALKFFELKKKCCYIRNSKILGQIMFMDSTYVEKIVDLNIVASKFQISNLPPSYWRRYVYLIHFIER